ncbi:MAG: response regulator [Deltaproteobacteria bacterium]|nr:response regulator [Deltaproteobacteria bacterium]
MRVQGAAARGLVLVSNDRHLRRQFRLCLSDLGIAAGALTTVKNGHECLTALARIRPRLVVLDDSVADPDGLTLLHLLHQRDPEVLIVYLTIHHTLELEREVRQNGVLYYTEKPPDSFLIGKVLGSIFTPPGGTSVPPPARPELPCPERGSGVTGSSLGIQRQR